MTVPEQLRAPSGAVSPTRADFEPRPARPVVGWATIGALFYLMGAYVIGRFLLNGPTPTHQGPTEVSTSLWVRIVGFQAIGVLAFLGAIYAWVVKPLRQNRRLSIDSLFVFAFFGLWWQDPLSNWNGIWWAYNSVYVNFGSWANFLPGWLTPNQHLVPEPSIAAGTTYVWGLFSGVVLCNMVMRKVRARRPRIGTPGLVGVAIGTMMLLDLVFEPLFMILFHPWSYPGSIKGLTLFEGTEHQYPLYEMFHWGMTWGLFACARFFTNDKGQTVAERGIDEVRVGGRGKTVIRFLAVSGILNTIMFFSFNVPTGLFWAPHSDPWPAEIMEKSYYVNGQCGPGTGYACGGSDVPQPKLDSRHVDSDGNLVGPSGAPRSREDSPNFGSLRGSFRNPPHR